MKGLEVTQKSSSLSFSKSTVSLAFFFFLPLYISLCTKMLFFVCLVWFFGWLLSLQILKNLRVFIWNTSLDKLVVCS